MGSGQATYYAWKSKYGGLEASDLKQLREIERQLSEYKTRVAELSHENRALKGLIDKKALAPSAKREAVTYLVNEQQLSVGRTCAVVRPSRSAYYQPRINWSERDRPIVEALNSAVAMNGSVGVLAVLRLATQWRLPFQSQAPVAGVLRPEAQPNTAHKTTPASN
jgi:hypothetical protein